jgi:hypothetical protein
MARYEARYEARWGAHAAEPRPAAVAHYLARPLRSLLQRRILSI